jgi:hypothetical protein
VIPTLEFLDEALEEAQQAARWYAGRSAMDVPNSESLWTKLSVRRDSAKAHEKLRQCVPDIAAAIRRQASSTSYRLANPIRAGFDKTV